MGNVINWFEIPVVDIDRAKGFYSAVLGASFDAMPDMPDVAFFSYDGQGVGGHLQTGQGTPSDHGPLIYLDAPKGVAAAIAEVEGAGGKVLTPSQAIGKFGYIGAFLDTEGNRVGLHSMTE